MLAVFAALYVAVAAYYYFRIIRACWLTGSGDKPAALDLGLGTRVALVGSGVLTVVIGVLPQRFLALAGRVGSPGLALTAPGSSRRHLRASPAANRASSTPRRKSSAGPPRFTDPATRRRRPTAAFNAPASGRRP